MELLMIALDAEKFDKAVHGDGVTPVLPDGGDLAFYIKPAALESGGAGVVATFTVALPDGTLARAQSVTTLKNFEMLLSAIKGWRQGGHIQ